MILARIRPIIPCKIMIGSDQSVGSMNRLSLDRMQTGVRRECGRNGAERRWPVVGCIDRHVVPVSGYEWRRCAHRRSGDSRRRAPLPVQPGTVMVMVNALVPRIPVLPARHGRNQRIGSSDLLNMLAFVHCCRDETVDTAHLDAATVRLVRAGSD